MKYRTLVSLTPEQMYMLKRLSREKGESVSELIRKAVDLLSQKEDTDQASLLLDRLALYEKQNRKKFKGSSDLSQKVDQIMYGTK
ncbi:MAG: hypothetical protein UT63_C0019G0013 [Candidatus Gottesmanbacteria bacterium GW2011_GWC2_39_8]|uniref:Predicted DNA-binding protein ribbon-helix-helix domain-containing protein n=1 Tax=Candidatus Gottesmanbacteria bacterium GW2011_GWC2_39_8 TaxID=1618450 RepID=A0A0G0Q7I6_9BACT|nr:MAG: hypothetical protein UT63_C0019G0013 [Candidatus Gottesmanbacteria bacterium GW2011_GWC2_39_8]